MVIGRDAVHKWMHDTFIKQTRRPAGRRSGSLRSDQAAARRRRDLSLRAGGRRAGHEATTRFVAAGPTTSIREEPYQADVMRHFNVKAVIGKGGMGPKTLAACQEVPGVYLHAIGGAASLIAQTVKVLGVYKL